MISTMNLIKIKAIAIKIAIYLSLIALIFLSGFFFSKNHWQAPLIKEKERLESTIKESDSKIKTIKDRAKVDSDNAKKDLEKKDQALDDIQRKYEEEKKKKKILTVYVPEAQKSIDVKVDKEGSLSCSDLGSDFKDAINEIVKESNK